MSTGSLVELFESGDAQYLWKDEKVIRRYRADGTEDPDVAITYGPDIGNIVGGLYVLDKKAKRVSPNACIVTIEFGEKRPKQESGPGSGQPLPQVPPSSYLSFDTSVATEHIVRARAQTRYGSPDFDPVDVIGANEKGDVEGVDIYMPSFAWETVKYWDNDDVDAAYVNLLYRYSRSVNSSTFDIFDAGESFFLGARGTRMSTTRWEIFYRFLAAPNETIAVTIDGEVHNIPKKGWQYIWYRHGRKVVPVAGPPAFKRLDWEIKGAFLATVYPTFNHNNINCF